MQMPTKKVNNHQLFFIIFMTLTTFTTITLPKTMAEIVGRTFWVPLYIMAIVFGILIFLICKVNYKYQGKALYDYGEVLFGKFINKIVICFYFLHFLIVGLFLKISLVGVIKSHFLINTPEVALLIVSLPVFAFIAYKGITNIARLFTIIGVFYIITATTLAILMMTQGLSVNIQPIFNAKELVNIKEAFFKLLPSFGGIEILFIIPFSSKNKKAPSLLFITLLLIGLFYILLVAATIMLLGINNTILMKFSIVEAIKMIQIPVIDRTDIFYIIFGIMTLFSGMIIVFSASLEFLCKIFTKAKRGYLSAILCVVYFILSLSLSMSNMSDAFKSFIPYLVMVSSIILPILIFVLSLFKKNNRRKKT